MGKVRKKRRSKTSAAISAATNPLHGKSELYRIRQAQAQPGLSRGKRRRLAKRERSATKAELVKILTKNREREESVRKNGKMGDMSDMSSSLSSLLEDLKGGASLLDASKGQQQRATTSQAAAADTKTNSNGLQEKTRGKKFKNKERSRIAALEVNNFSMVVNHAAFQANPLAAIQEHLRNTVANSN